MGELGLPQSKLSMSTQSYLVPALYRLCLDSMEDTQPTDAVKEWESSGKTILWLCGPHGVGKSVAAAQWLVRSAQDLIKGGCDDYPDGKWVPAMEIVSRGQGPRWSDYARDIIYADFLVIDDIPTKIGTPHYEYFEDLFGYIINQRYAMLRKTILISGGDASVAERVCDGLVYNRICHHGMVRYVTGPNRMLGEK